VLSLLFAILSGAAAGFSAYYFSPVNSVFLAAWVGCLPIALRIFRRPIDRCIGPLQGVKDVIPGKLLALIGIAIPFGISFLFSRLTNDPNMTLTLTMILGGPLAYAVMRRPEPAEAQ